MVRKLSLVAVVGLVCAAASLAADEPKAPLPGKLEKLDKAKLFAKLDADGDGKLSKDEFKKFTDTVREKLKDKGKGDKIPEGALGEKMFGLIDTDKDGTVSKDEFEKFDAKAKLGDLKGRKK